MQASDFDPTNPVLLSNRSVCWMRLGQPEQALTDARSARELDPTWSKPCYREGAALRQLQVPLFLFDAYDLYLIVKTLTNDFHLFLDAMLVLSGS